MNIFAHCTKRRTLRSMRAVALPVLLPCLLLAQPAAAQESKRPNLIVVVTDDQRFDQLGVEGHPVLQTPTMDSLAKSGVRFTNSFVTTPICAASRASLFTGRREGRHGYTFGTPPMGAELASETYFARLHGAGYRTGFVGKWGVRFEPEAMRGHIDSFRPMSQPYLKEGKAHLTERVADTAIAFIEDESEGAPFCLTLSFWAPHAEQTSLGRKRWGWRFDTREKQVKRTKDYWRMITGVDRALGRVLGALDESGLANNTVIIFTSDNGYFLGERGLAGKWFIYEESIRVPLIVVDPRAAAGRRGTVQDSIVLNVDIAPTLLDLAGLEAPAGYGGQSLVPLLRSETPAWRTDFLVEHLFDHAEIPKSVGVRGERWVYARYDDQDPPFEQLFDLSTDPAELVDLARDPAFADVLVKQRGRCDELLAK